MTRKVIPTRDMAYVSITFHSGLTYKLQLDITPNEKYPLSDTMLSRDKLERLLNTSQPVTFNTVNMINNPNGFLTPDNIVPDSETVTIKQAHVAMVRVQYKKEPVPAKVGT